jgi:alpha,alpha-trehalase
MGKREAREWELIYTDWDPREQKLREALCALGNGHIVTRGAFEEVTAGDVHYPGTYLAGGYNRLETEIEGHVLESEDLVNWPNWLPLTFRAQGAGDWFRMDGVELLDFKVCLDVRRGLLERHVRFRDRDGREFSLTCQRLVHMALPHMAAIEWSITAHNWTGNLEIRAGLDGSVRNGNVARYQNLANQHLDVLNAGFDGDDGVFLTVATNQSHIRMVQAARTRVLEGDVPVATKRERNAESGRVEHRLVVPCAQGKELRVEKIVSIRTSRDFAISDPETDARRDARRAGSFADLLVTHERRWRHLWDAADIELRNGDVSTQLILRLHVFHLLQSVSPNTIDRDVGVPSRGWHGEAYRGHVLWDELFIFPFLILRVPELTRSLLMYRYRRLPEARYLAREAGYRGAMLPGQSGSDGREESQVLHLNPTSGRWIPDESHRQRHVSAAIAYNVWLYYQATGDLEFLAFHGAELVFDIARFWASIATYDAQRDRFEIRGVMGPDEFHTRYPGAEELGLNNNAYTNVMAAWVLRCARQVMRLLDEDRRRELVEQLALDDEELLRWDTISRKLVVPFHDGGIISQFEGYEALKEFDWEGYREKYGDIHRLDRILEAEHDDVNAYKASKQADVVMLFFLFTPGELRRLLEHMGYSSDRQLIPRNVDYYMRRTSHGSTLSRIVHSWVLARTDRAAAWGFFQQALQSDIEDIQGGTTPEGIHLGAMAGTVDLIQRCHTGIHIDEDALWFDPVLPRELSDVRLRLRYREQWLSAIITPDELKVTCDRGWSPAVSIGFRGQTVQLSQGDSRVFPLTEHRR